MTKAYYMVISHCTKEVVWLRQLLADVIYGEEGLTSIMCDDKDGQHLQIIPHTILIPNISMYNIISLGRN